MDEGHVPLVDIVGESMRVGKYQDQMICARISKRSGDFPRNSKLRNRFAVAWAILQDIQISHLLWSSRTRQLAMKRDAGAVMAEPAISYP